MGRQLTRGGGLSPFCRVVILLSLKGTATKNAQMLLGKRGKRGKPPLAGLLLGNKRGKCTNVALYALQVY